MKLIIWNFQGIGGDLKVDNLLEQCRLYTPDIIVLLETKNNSRNYVYLKMKLGMEFMHAVEPKGIGGGLCMFWRVASHVILANTLSSSSRQRFGMKESHVIGIYL